MADVELDLTERPACPLLGLPFDRHTHYTVPDPAHRCFAQKRLATADATRQATYCLTPRFSECERFRRSRHPDAAGHRSRLPASVDPESDPHGSALVTAPSLAEPSQAPASSAIDGPRPPSVVVRLPAQHRAESRQPLAAARGLLVRLVSGPLARVRAKQAAKFDAAATELLQSALKLEPAAPLNPAHRAAPSAGKPMPVAPTAQVAASGAGPPPATARVHLPATLAVTPTTAPASESMASGPASVGGRDAVATAAARASSSADAPAHVSADVAPRNTRRRDSGAALLVVGLLGILIFGLVATLGRTPEGSAVGAASPTRSPQATAIAVPSAALAATPTPTPLPSPTPGRTPNPTPTPLPSPTPGRTPNPTPTPLPSPTPGRTPNPTPTPLPSPTPGRTPNPTPTPLPSPTPGRTPNPTPVLITPPPH